MSPPRPLSVQPKTTTPSPVSPEIQAAESAYREAGFALRRAEAALAKAKKEQGPDSAEAKAAQQKVVEANAAHEKAQQALKERLGLVTKRSPAPAPRAVAKAPAESKPSAKNPPESVKKIDVYLERVEVLPKTQIRELEQIKSEQIRKILETLRKDSKNGEMLMELRTLPQGEMLIRQTKLLRKRAPEKPKPVHQPGS
ncbi:hypothetical protein FBR05_05590 [Deltaproteobacteria bacterium PRO3]|nr:hypothetical protein [Deltaproteobacteria bacterium PRO3]